MYICGQFTVIEIWCNGSTTDFGSVCPGSNPGISTKCHEKTVCNTVFCRDAAVPADRQYAWNAGWRTCQASSGIHGFSISRNIRLACNPFSGTILRAYGSIGLHIARHLFSGSRRLHRNQSGADKLQLRDRICVAHQILLQVEENRQAVPSVGIANCFKKVTFEISIRTLIIPGITVEKGSWESGIGVVLGLTF